MDGPISPVNPTRTERVQGTVNTPVDPQKLAALREKLELPLPAADTGGALGADQVVISEIGKALCRFAQTLQSNPEVLTAFTEKLPAELLQTVQNQGGRPVNYDMALQLCMALYGPDVQARAAAYGKNRRRRIDRYDYYRALMEHFGLQYDGDAPEEEKSSPWERFLSRLRSMVAGGEGQGAETGGEAPARQTEKREPAPDGRQEAADSGETPPVQEEREADTSEEPPAQEEPPVPEEPQVPSREPPGGLPRLWP